MMLDKKRIAEVLDSMGYDVEFDSPKPGYIDEKGNFTSWDNIPVVYKENFDSQLPYYEVAVSPIKNVEYFSLGKEQNVSIEYKEINSKDSEKIINGIEFRGLVA